MKQKVENVMDWFKLAKYGVYQLQTAMHSKPSLLG
jgi:hypothetical protein